MERQDHWVEWEIEGSAGCREDWLRTEHQGLQEGLGFALQGREQTGREDSNHRDLFSVEHL